MGQTINLNGVDLLIGHLLIIAIFYLLTRHNSKFQVITECLVVGLLPFFGVVFMLIMKAFNLYHHYRGDNPDVYQHLQNENSVLGGQLQTEVNIIPLNDALFIEDIKEKRALLTNAIKQNVLDNGSILRKALRDPDREVSHYAVSMLTHQIENVEAELFKIEQELAVKGEDKVLLVNYADKMKEYLMIEFLDQVSQRKNEERYVALLERVLAAGEIKIAIYGELIDYLIKFGEYTKAEGLCAQFAERFPLEEEPFLAYLQLYWEMKKFDAFQGKIKELKASPIQLTSQALAIIRFWNLGERYV